MENDEFDIVLIGAGVIGLSLAFRLKQVRGDLRIAVLGDPMNSLMASRAAAGMLAPFGECRRADRFFGFCRESLEKYPSFIEELVAVSDVPVFFSMQGSLMPSAFYGDNWDEQKRFFRQEKIRHEVWTPAKVKEKASYLSPDCGEVLWVGEGQVNNRQLHDSLSQAMHALGVTVFEKNVTGFIRDESGIESAVTDSGDIKGKKFVLASGSWSQKLGEVLDVSMPMKPIKGQMCRVQVDDGFLEYTVHGLLTYIAPWRGGHGFVLGSTMEDRGFDASVEETVIQSLIDRASAILPCLKEAPLIESWTGLRPAADDLMPIMGKSVRYQNLYYSTGHYRNGILQTPNQADYVTGIILETLKDEIAEFSPSRYRL